jgi:putative RNA 2'-phosphotransferase
MDERARTKLSKYLSKHLRHTPERIGLTLQEGGWVGIDELIAACDKKGRTFSREHLQEIVEMDTKQRYSIDRATNRIRANQGHSTDVDLQLNPSTPPAVLYHGTGATSVEAIGNDGLKRMQRHHVHLSSDIETARKVGARHGRPVVLKIDTVAMRKAGHVFYLSENGVWLTDEVPPKFLTPADVPRPVAPKP